MLNDILYLKFAKKTFIGNYNPSCKKYHVQIVFETIKTIIITSQSEVNYVQVLLKP